MISIISLYKIIWDTEEAYVNQYGHGLWGKTKAVGKSATLGTAFKLTLLNRQQGQPMDPKNSFIHYIMSRVKSGGHHKVGSYRTIMVQKLYKELGFGEINQDALAVNPKWREVRDLVHGKLTEIANDPAWQETFGVEYLTYSDHQFIRTTLNMMPGLREVYALLGVELYNENHKELIANCYSILDVDVNVDLDEKRIPFCNPEEVRRAELLHRATTQAERLKGMVKEMEDEGQEQNTKARLLSIIDVAVKVIDRHQLKPEDPSKFFFNPLTEDNMQFWLEKAPVAPKQQDEERQEEGLGAMFPG